MTTGEPITAKLFAPYGQAREYIVDFQPTDFDYEMMTRALEEARMALYEGNNPVGAVLVNYRSRQKDPTVYEARSTEFSTQDLTAHAEVNVYKKAQADLGRNLGSCAMYSTAEPCVACAYFLYKGGVGSIFYAARRDDAPGFFRPRTIDYEDVLRESGRTVLVVGGLLREQAAALLTEQNRKH